VSRIQRGHPDGLEEGGLDVISVKIQGTLLADVDVPAVAGVHDRQPHLVQARRLARQRLVDAHPGLAHPRPHHALVVGHQRLQARLERAQGLAGQEPVAVEGHDNALREQQGPQVVAGQGKLFPGHPDAALEH
jgi:hypothetical protein